jgi:hypothetical protein
MAYSTIFRSPRRVTNGKESRKVAVEKEKAPVKDEQGARCAFFESVMNFTKRFFSNPSYSLSTKTNSLFIAGAGTTGHRIFIHSLLRELLGIIDSDPCMDMKSQSNLKNIADDIWNDILPEEAKENRQAFANFVMNNKVRLSKTTTN